MSELWDWITTFTQYKRELSVPPHNEREITPSRLTVKVENGTIEIRMIGDAAVISITEHKDG